MKAHPDKGGSEAKMAAVNEAYEVLNNPGMPLSILFCLCRALILTLTELRQRFDNGDDPNDPTAGQGGPGGFPGGFPSGGGHPFAQFVQQGSGGGFPGGGFQFHFSGGRGF